MQLKINLTPPINFAIANTRKNGVYISGGYRRDPDYYAANL